MIRFFLSLSLVAALLVIVAWIVVEKQWIEALPSFFFESLIFLLFGTGILFVYLYKFDKPDYFVQLYLLSMALKLIAYGAYNFFVIVEDEKGATLNVSWFMLVYFFFSALEIAFLYQKITNRSGK
ncbi:hypothetical protein [Chryseolinea sp. H1M3-3]|uniref:hypothetical protein n=1 Tax=Chryseolinea sp. H1M3-3 TaxID=3034144 RepID=UPI0023EAE2DA|nr:hypothetical protein [Chryseolinea sp. H1M3-3]